MIYYPLLLLNCTRHTMKMTFAFSHIKSAEGIGAVFFFVFFSLLSVLSQQFPLLPDFLLSYANHSMNLPTDLGVLINSDKSRHWRNSNNTFPLKHNTFHSQMSEHCQVRQGLSLPLSCYTTISVLCVIKMWYNSHFSRFFLRAALLLSVALSVEELIRTAAEFMQRSWKLGLSTVDVSVRLPLSAYQV